jgi:hypothetical protein
MAALARRRRSRAVSRYFSFTSRELVANPAFKQTMVADGRFHEVDKDLWEFPSVAAAILKGKKHEWIVVAFESGQKVKRMWLNKGPDGTTVAAMLPVERVLEIAVLAKYQTVLVLHNHPNPDPVLVDCSMASERDHDHAARWGEALNQKGINLLEFVCERGSHYQYYEAVAESFMPLTQFEEEVKRQCSLPNVDNRALRREL